MGLVERRAKAFTHSSIDTFFPIFNEYRKLSSSGALQYFSDLRDCLLQNLGGTDVDFGDYNHYGYIQCQGNTEMLSKGTC